MYEVIKKLTFNDGSMATVVCRSEADAEEIARRFSLHDDLRDCCHRLKARLTNALNPKFHPLTDAEAVATRKLIDKTRKLLMACGPDSP